MPRVLILGLGYIGSKLKTFLEEKNVVVTAYSQKILDYTSESELRRILSNGVFDCVVNCSGYTGSPNVDGCESNKELCYYYNVKIGLLINKLCTEYKINHICVSSGCIYTGYEKQFTENDIPNFGLFNPDSSFYSKTKHILETIFDFTNSSILRIRMPFDGNPENKNYLYKLYKYNDLISFDNSLTNVNDLCNFIYKMINKFYPGIFNVVNSQKINAQQIIEIFKKNNLVNPNWRFVEIKDLNIIAGRSNCVLSSTKISNIGYSLSDTFSSVEQAVKQLKANL